MKLFIIASLIVLCSASTLYRGKNVSVKDDGTVVITNEVGKRVVISKADGQKNIEIEVSGPHMITKKIHIDGESNVRTEMGNPMFSTDIEEELRDKREPHHHHKQQEQQEDEERPELGLFGKGGINLFDITGGQLTRQQPQQLQQQIEQQQNLEIVEQLQQQQKNVQQIIDQLQQQEQQCTENIANLLQQKQQEQWGVGLRPWQQQQQTVQLYCNLQQQTANVVHQLQQQQKQIANVVNLLLQQQQVKLQQTAIWMRKQFEQKLQEQQQCQQQLEQQQIQQQLRQQQQDVINQQQFSVITGQVQPLIPGSVIGGGFQPVLGRPTGRSTIIDYLLGQAPQLGGGVWGGPRGVYGTLPQQFVL